MSSPTDPVAETFIAYLVYRLAERVQGSVEAAEPYQKFHALATHDLSYEEYQEFCERHGRYAQVQQRLKERAENGG